MLLRHKENPYEVYVLRKKVNHLSGSRQLFKGERVNLFRMDRHTLYHCTIVPLEFSILVQKNKECNNCIYIIYYNIL